MDFEQVELHSRMLLEASSRFGGPVNRLQIVDVATNNDSSWRNDPARLRLYTRALHLLVQFGYLEPDASGLNLVTSEAGRRTLSNAEPLHFSAEWLKEWIRDEEIREALDTKVKLNANTFGELKIGMWRQFENINIDFHKRLTIITGANAAGKTTILNILAPHLNWNAQLLVRGNTSRDGLDGGVVGTLTYTNGGATDLVEQPGDGIRNAPLAMPAVQPVPGMFISSHRSISSYQPLTALPPRFSETGSLLAQFSAEVQARYQGGTSQYSPLYRMKESLFAAAMYGYGNRSVRANDLAREVWEGFQTVLKDFLPPSLEFKELLVDDSELIVRTATSEFPIEAISGGLSAMMELSWQIFLRKRDQPSFTVCIDEPENHLHPELQRTIMPSLIKAFPNVNFIVATHSPFVVTSSKDAAVYALSRSIDDAAVSSRKIESVNFSASADETLSSVLGLDSTLPLWAERGVSDLLATISDDPDANDLRRLREGLEELGLSRQFPAAVRSIATHEDNSDPAV